MGFIKVSGKNIEVDEEGYLVNRADWSEEVATAMARADGIELTPDHWEIINFVRAYYDEHETTPNAYVPINATPEKYGLDEGTQKFPNRPAYKLFPGGASQVIRYAGLPKANGPLKYAPAVVSADRVHEAPLGPKHTMLLFDDIQAEGEIQYAFLLAVFDNAIRKPVYYVSSEVNAMASVLHDGSHYLCTFSAEGHWNRGGSDDWGDPDKFFLQAIYLAAEHFGVAPEEVGKQDNDGLAPLPEFPELLDAAVKGDSAGVKALLAKGAEVNEKNADGVTALMLASGRGHGEIVELLLAQGAAANAKSNAGHTALIFACNQGHPGIVKVLLNAGAEVNARGEEGVTALLSAALTGQAEIVKALLKKGAEVNVRTDKGISALEWASLKGHTETVKVLLNNGADVNAKNKGDETALMLASEKGHTEIIRLLKQAGARSE